MSKLPEGYILLWVITVLILVFIIIAFFYLKLGQGRWECGEYETIGKECHYKHSSIYPGGISPNPICAEEKDVCIKEVWTRK